MSQGTPLDTRYITALSQALYDVQTQQLEEGSTPLLQDFENILSEAMEKGVVAAHLVPGRPVQFHTLSDILTTDIQVDLGNAGEVHETTYPAAGFIARYRVNTGMYDERSVVIAVAQVSGAYFIHVNIFPNRIQSPQELGVPSEVQEWVKGARGMFFFSGPTASGKTTTLRSLIRAQQLEDTKTIVSLEYPISVVFPMDGKSTVLQYDVTQHSQGFEGAFKEALRHSPDIVVVDEVREEREIDMLVYAADTGHVTFSTIHGNSCIQSLHRIVSSSDTIADTMIRDKGGIVHQVCVQGFGGRSYDTPVYETLYIDDTVAMMLMVRDWNGLQEYQDERKQSMEHALVRAVLDKKCSVESARAAAVREYMFDAVLRTQDV